VNLSQVKQRLGRYGDKKEYSWTLVKKENPIEKFFVKLVFYDWIGNLARNKIKIGYIA
jgi:hypothetical protein